MRDAHLPLDVAAWPSSSISRQITAAPYFLAKREDAVEARAGRLAVFEVGRVEDGATTDPFEAGFEHLGFGRVEHERRRDLRGEAARDLVHVVRAVAADVVDAHVEHVRAFLHLLARHLHAGVPVALEHRVAELARAVGVGALADDHERRVLLERHERVDRRGPGLVLGRARRRSEVAAAVDDGRDVLGRRTAAATDDRHAEFGDEALVEIGELLGREVVVHVAVDDRRQAGVGQARDGDARVLRERAGARSSRPGPSRS